MPGLEITFNRNHRHKLQIYLISNEKVESLKVTDFDFFMP